MTVTLNPQLEAFVRQKVDAGSYRTADEVMEEALRLLDERDRLERLRALIRVGMESGEGVEYTPELMDEIEREAEEAFLRGEKPSPDVCP